MKKLEIGSGNRPLDGYDHLDIDPNLPHLEFVSSMDQIPVADNIYDEVKSIHSLEHISWRKGVDTLKEWFRVLKPGGKVHIAVPNLRWIVKSYLENDSSKWFADYKRMAPEEKEHLKINGFACHTLWANFKLFSSTGNGDVHLAGYDAFLLTEVLKAAGFKNCTVLHDGDSLIMEARKP